MVVSESGNGNREADEQGMKNREQGIPNEELPSGQLSTVNHQQKDGRRQMADGGRTDNVNEQGNTNKEMPSCQPPTAIRQPLQVAFSVPRRQFKKAVHRNRIKRLMREAWRLQKNPLQEILLTKGIQLRVYLIYTGRDLPKWTLVQEKLKGIMVRLQKLIHEKSADHT